MTKAEKKIINEVALYFVKHIEAGMNTKDAMEQAFTDHLDMCCEMISQRTPRSKLALDVMFERTGRKIWSEANA